MSATEAPARDGCVSSAHAAQEMFSVARAAGVWGRGLSAIVDALCEATGIDKPRVPEGWKPA